MKQRTEVLINVHKGLRKGLLGLSVRIGAADWEDRIEVGALDTEFSTLLHFLWEHAANEEDIQFPPLENRVPGTTRLETEDHRRLEAQVNHLEKQWAGLLSEEDKWDGGYRFYLAYNRFLSGYLSHMDREETDLTENYYQNFSDAEIETEFKKIIARTRPEEMGMMLGYMIPGMNPSERTSFLKKIKSSAPAEVFSGVMELARKVLSASEWGKCSARLG